MRVLVTGPDGLLGSNLVRRLLEKDYEVRALVFPGSRSRTLDGLKIEKVDGNITDSDSIRRAVAGCEGVFHVAASTAMWPPRDPKITAINVNGTRNVMEAAEAAGVRRVVHCGSASSFGYGTKENPGTEKAPFRYAGLGLAYFDSKLAAQELVLDMVRSGRIEAVVVNPTFMFGPHDSGPSSGEVIIQYVKMNIPAYSPGGRNFAHARDVADGLISAFEKGAPGECYILGNRNMNMKELLGLVAEIAGIRKPVVEIPALVIRLAGKAGSALGEALKKKPGISYEVAVLSCIGCYYSPAKAVRELDLPQTPVETAVEDEYRWLRDNGYMK